MKKAKYLSAIFTIVLVIALLGASFAWYSSGSAAVRAQGLTVQAAKPGEATIRFVYDEDDVDSSDSSNRVMVSSVHQVKDEWGRFKYTGEEGNVSGASPNEDLDYKFTAYFLIELTNPNDTPKTLSFSIEEAYVYKTGGNQYFSIDTGADYGNYYYSGANVYTRGHAVVGTYDAVEESVTISGDTYYFYEGVVCGQRTSLGAGQYEYRDQVGYIGDKVTDNTIGTAAPNFTLKYFDFRDMRDTYAITYTDNFYQLSAGCDVLTSATTVESAGNASGANSTQVLLAITYYNGADAFAYSSTDYIGAFFNFVIGMEEL